MSISPRQQEEIRKISLRRSFEKKWKKFPHYNGIRDGVEALGIGTFVRKSELLFRYLIERPVQ